MSGTHGRSRGDWAWISGTRVSSGMGRVSSEVIERTAGEKTQGDRDCDVPPWTGRCRRNRMECRTNAFDRPAKLPGLPVEGDRDPLGPGARLGVGGACWGRQRPGSRGRHTWPSRAKPPSRWADTQGWRRRPKALLKVRSSKKRQHDLCADYSEPLKCPSPHLGSTPSPRVSVRV